MNQLQIGNTEGARLRGRVPLGFTWRFAVKKLLVTSSVCLVCQALFLARGQALLGLLMLPVALWPYRVELLVDARGVRASWWFLREWVDWNELSGAVVIADPRKFVIGRRQPVLKLECRNRRPVIIHGDPRGLERLAEEVRSELRKL